MDSTILLIVAGAGILIGILIGFLINTLRGESGRRSPTESEVRGIDNILLWHDRQGGSLIVDLDGSTFTGASQMHPEQRARLETCYTQLKRFLGMQESTPATETPKAPPGSPPGKAPIAVAAQATPSGSGQKPSPQADDKAENKKTSGKKGKPEPIKPLSIVSEIDDILQEMITWSSLATRGLRVIETPEHTMNIILDVKQYETIDEVPDPEAQQMVREAIKLWESKTT